MNEHILTIIDTKGELRELNLDHFRKSDITLGRDASRCDIVIPESDCIQGSRNIFYGRRADPVPGSGQS